MSYTRGRHALKIGGELSLEKYVLGTTLTNYGAFSFDGSKSGSALADFVLGLPRTMNQDTPNNKVTNGWYGGMFVQDDFRIHPRLTLNLGVRWDLQMPHTDTRDRQNTFVVGLQSRVVPTAPIGLLFPGDPGVTRGTVEADKNNFAPRVGLAWDASGDGRTSIRVAAGLFYGSISGNQWDATSDNQPFAVRQQFNDVKSLTDPYGNLLGGLSPFPYYYTRENPRFLHPSRILGTQLDFVWPYTYQFNFSVQRQLARDVSVTAAYVSALGHRLPFLHDINYPVYNSRASAQDVNLRRPIQPGILSEILMMKSIMNTAHHSFQTTVEKRMGRHFGFKGFYTFGKSLGAAQLQNTTANGGAQNMNNLAAERARLDTDRSQNLVSSVIWQPDYFGGPNGLIRGVLNGWMLSAIVTLRSGAPFTVTTGRDNNLDGASNDRPNLIGNAKLDPNRSRAAAAARWFDPAAFVPNPVGADGNAGRNILDGPGIRNVDLGIFRNVRLREQLQLQVRGELTNAFNLVNLSAPTANLNSSVVGVIRNAREMRQLQLGVRMVF